MKTDQALSVYVHIPICVHKCYYCDFHSKTVDAGERSTYLEALVTEIRNCPWRGAEARTLFLGGGTPSELTGDEIEEITAALHDTFSILDESEWTIECNPGTVSPATCDRLIDLGFDRVSVGVQSFRDSFLRTLGRIHTGAQGIRCCERLRAAGFENISLDLIFGIPEQSVGQWEEDLNQAIELGPEHLSLYSLTIEPNTPFRHLLETGRIRECPENAAAEMYELAMDLTEQAGYRQYEISNYSIPGFECLHNLAYWNNEPYLGFGVSAASYIDNTRWTNTTDWEAYFEGARKGRIPRMQEEKLEWPLALGEEVMLQLRTDRGVSPGRLSEKYGCDFEVLFSSSIRIMTREQLLKRNKDRLILTRRGKLLANEVCSEFLKSSKRIDKLQQPGRLASGEARKS